MGEKIAIKANINGSAVFDDDTSGKTQMSYTNPVLLKALLTSLVKEGGVNPSDITVYDVSRLFPDYMVEMCTVGELKGVQFVGRGNGVADENAPINWSQKFSGKVNYLPSCLWKYYASAGRSKPAPVADKIGDGHLQSAGRFDANLGGKTVLYMLDAFICAPSEGASITAENSKWQQTPFNGDYTSSIFVSQDPVAIDSVGADFLNNEPAVTGNNRSAADITNENYLHEAGLVGNAPSGTTYTDGNGHTLTNLGVHEHWNNSEQKLYSRNRGKEEGIELVQIK